MTSNSLTIEYIDHGNVAFTQIVGFHNPQWAAESSLRRQGIAAPEAIKTLPIGETLDLGNGLAIRIVDTDSLALRAETDAFLDDVESRCDQCGSKLTASRHCTNCR